MGYPDSRTLQCESPLTGDWRSLSYIRITIAGSIDPYISSSHYSTIADSRRRRSDNTVKATSSAPTPAPAPAPALVTACSDPPLAATSCCPGRDRPVAKRQSRSPSSIELRGGGAEANDGREGGGRALGRPPGGVGGAAIASASARGRPNVALPPRALYWQEHTTVREE